MLDEFIAQHPGGPGIGRVAAAKRRRHGLPNCRLVRYADDWCLTVHGTLDDAVELRNEIAKVLTTMGLRLSEEKTLITHIDEGLDFLGWRIQRHRKRGTNRQHIYTYPAKKASADVMAKVKMLCRQIGTNQPLDALLGRLNPVVQGWCAHFKVGVSSASFSYLRHYLWQSVWGWLRRKHPKSNWKEIRRRYCDGGSWPATKDKALFDPTTVAIHRYRGTKIPTPWPTTG